MFEKKFEAKAAEHLLHAPLWGKEPCFFAFDRFLIKFDVFFINFSLNYLIKFSCKMANLRLISSNDLDTGSVAPPGQVGK